MDPNEALRKLLELAERAIKESEGPGIDAEFLSNLSVDMADLVQALDGWLTGGGFLPSKWGARTGAMMILPAAGVQQNVVRLNALGLVVYSIVPIENGLVRMWITGK